MNFKEKYANFLYCWLSENYITNYIPKFNFTIG